MNTRTFLQIILLLLTAPPQVVEAQTVYNVEPGLGVNQGATPTATSYQVRLSAINAAAATGTFVVSRVGGGTFAEAGRVDIRTGGRGSANPIVDSAVYNGNNTVGTVTVTNTPLPGAGGARTAYYATRWATVTNMFDGNQWAGPIWVNPSPNLTGASATMRADGRIDAAYTPTDADGISLVDYYLVHEDETTIPSSADNSSSFASKVSIPTPASGVPRAGTVQWTAAQLNTWLTAGSRYRIRFSVQDTRGVWSNYFFSNAFTYTPVPQPLPPPENLSFNNVTQTQARLDWTWNGGNANADHAELRLVRTSTMTSTDTLEVLIAAGYLFSSERSVLLHLASPVALKPGQYYRANIKYYAAPGYTDTNAGAAKTFQTTPLSPPSGLSANVQNLDINFSWSATNAAQLYRLQVKKAGTAWTAAGQDAVAATQNMPVNVRLDGNAATSFRWNWNANWAATSAVAGLPIPSQQYEWRVKAAYDDTIGVDNWSSTFSFSPPANSLPNITAASVTSAAGDVVLNFTPTDAQDSQLRYDLHIYNAAGTALVGGGFGIQQWFESMNGVQRSYTWTSAALGGALTNGQNYQVKIDLFDPAFQANFTNTRALFIPFTYQSVVPNPLGLDTASLNNKKLGGLIYIPGESVEAPSGSSWSTFFLRMGTTNIAQTAADFPTLYVNTENVIWRNMAGQPAIYWPDLLTGTGPFTLKVVGRAANNVEVESAPFTFTLQTALVVGITSSDGFPRFRQPSASPPAATVFTLTGAAGAVSRYWWGGGGGNRTGTTYSPVINTVGMNLIRCSVTDASGNLTVAGFQAPIAWRARCGSPNQADGGSFIYDATDVSSGNLHLGFADMAVSAIGIPFSLTRSYNGCPADQFGTAAAATGLWRFNLEESVQYLHINSFISTAYNWPVISYRKGDGSTLYFTLGLDGKWHATTPGNHDLVVDDYNAQTVTIYSDGASPVVRTFESISTTRTEASYRLKSIKNLRGHGLTVNYTTTPGTKISSVTDQSGRNYIFSYNDPDAPTRISQVSDFSGRTVSYDWNADGNLLTFRDVRSNAGAAYYTTFNYATSGNGNKRLTSIVQPEGNSPISSITYDASRRVSRVDHPHSSYAAFTYNAGSTIVDRPGSDSDLSFTLNTDGNITEVREAYGSGGERVTTLARLGTGNLGGNPYRAGDLGLTSSSTPSGAVTTALAYTSDGRGLLSSTQRNGLLAATTNYAQNTPINLAVPTSLTDSRGKTSTASFNTNTGDLNYILNQAGQGGRILSYDANGLPLTVADGRGATSGSNGQAYVTTYTYTATGDISTITVPDTDAANSAQRTVTFTYPAGNANRGLPSRITDRKGYSTDFQYDAANNITRVTAASLTVGAGEVNYVTVTYDLNGRRTSVTNRRNATTTFAYDLLNRPTSITQPAAGGNPSATATTTYDALGRVVDTTNFNLKTVRRTYVTSGAGAGMPYQTITQSASPPFAIQTISYLSDGRTNTVTDGTGITSTYRYDSLMRPDRITDALGNYAEVAYDANDNIIRRTIGKTGYSGPPLPITLYEYDDANRLSRVINVMNGNLNPDAAENIRTRVASYDALDNPLQIVDPRGYNILHTYDSLGRLSIRQDHAGRSWSFTYDPNGNLLNEIFPSGRTLARTYGPEDRLATLNYGDGITPTVSYAYDANGNRTGMTDRHGRADYAYDALNRLTNLTRNISGNSQSLAYTWFPGGQLKTLTYPGSRTVTYAYDFLDRLSTVQTWAPPPNTFTFTWRNDSRLDLLTNPNGTSTDYSYDGAGRLSQLLNRFAGGGTMARQEFTYDPAGHITRIMGEQPVAPPSDATLAMTYDATNRLSTAGGSPATVDTDGRATSLPGPTPGTAEWEGMDWLASYTTAAGRTDYTYDGDGIRLSRTPPGTAATRYLVDPMGDLPNVVAETDANFSPQRFYIHAPGYGLLAGIDTSGTVSTYHFNHRGDTLAMTSVTGTLTETNGYSPFGRTGTQNAVATNPFRFGGQFGVMDEGNGLNFMRARYYSPSLYKFCSPDPVAGSLATAQSINRFSFVTGSPLNLVDPTGNQGRPFSQGIEIAGTTIGWVDTGSEALLAAAGQSMPGILGNTALFLDGASIAATLSEEGGTEALLSALEKAGSAAIGKACAIPLGGKTPAAILADQACSQIYASTYKPITTAGGNAVRFLGEQLANLWAKTSQARMLARSDIAVISSSEWVGMQKYLIGEKLDKLNQHAFNDLNDENSSFWMFAFDRKKLSRKTIKKYNGWLIDARENMLQARLNDK